MPTELRQVVFTKDEFIQAAVAHSRVSGERIISGEVTSCNLEESEPVTIVALARSDKGSTKIKSVLEVAFIQEALIRFCLENNIMIPRDSRKSISVRSGQIALIIKMPKAGSAGD